MALLMMANDEGKPFFHDFFGVTCTDSSAPAGFPKKAVGETRLSSASPSASVGASSGGHGHVSPNSDLGSERQAGTNFEGVQFHGPKSDFSGTEISHKLSGRKRSNSDSTFMASTRDRILQMGPESVESSRLMKMFSNEPGSERPRQSQEDELLFGMQPPKTASIAPLIRQAPISNRSDLVVSNWERSVPMNLGPIVHYPSRLGQFAPYVDKHSSIRMKDISASTSLISPPAADEGSRTGIKGSGILNIINSGTGGSERYPSGVLLNNNRAKPGVHNIETEYASQPSRHSLTSTCHQMTIFYDGQAHVFDDVHPNKADAIMALAGSNGGSWSTTYSPKTSARPPLAEAYTPSGENDASINNSRAAFSQDAQGRHSIVRTSSQGLGQVARISISNPGAHQGGRPVRDARIVAQAVEPDTDGKKEV